MAVILLGEIIPDGFRLHEPGLSFSDMIRKSCRVKRESNKSGFILSTLRCLARPPPSLLRSSLSLFQLSQVSMKHFTVSRHET